MSDTDIVFEQPVSERVRTMLRLEHLFAQLGHHRQDESPWGMRASIVTLIDILSLFSRNDLKTEISRELGERRQALLPLRDRPGVDEGLLDEALGQLESTISDIQGCSSQRISQTLKDSDFLLAIINRSTIPGGTCHIDLPQFHRWLEASPTTSSNDMDSWLGNLRIFESAVALYMRLLRQSSHWKDTDAVDGMYVHSGQDKYHLIRLALPRGSHLYPEISAGRQRFSVRFMQQDSARAAAVHQTHPIRFKLSLCSL
ncbi:MAG: cell division protein ZapD [Oceanococcus sp.]|nr:MAG: cell division protein ZapD [Oceanococcus sp.]